MKVLRRAACVLLAALSLLALPAHSTSFSTDQSDLWYIPGESGWGIQIVQRGSTIFATMFVYGPSTAPTWYVATMYPTGASFTWSGDLYATTGPWFGTVPFNSANVLPTKVGTMTWQGLFVETAQLSYVVNGTFVVKNVVRQPIANENYAGHYAGGVHQDVTGCSNAAFNGTYESIGTLNITQNGQAVNIQSFTSGGASCSYPGALTQFGQMGAINGSYACSDGEAGTFSLFEMQVTLVGFTGRFTANSSNPPGCRLTGWFGGMRVTTF
jgi:hypothetical protein